MSTQHNFGPVGIIAPSTAELPDARLLPLGDYFVSESDGKTYFVVRGVGGVHTWKIVSGGASAGLVDIVAVPFTFATASPLALEALASGAVITTAVVQIETPFDSLGATLQLGTSLTPGLLLNAVEIDPRMANQYSNLAAMLFSVPQTLRLTIVPAGSTMGRGTVIYTIKR